MSNTFLNEKIHPGLKKSVIEKGWKNFSDIQISAFEPIYNGEDCIIEAPTSGGKTEAVLFPTLSKIANDKLDGVKILYLAPLKALLNNIEIRAKEYSVACGLHSFKWHGDVSQTKKIEEFNNPSQLLLTTPESLEAILLRKVNWQDVFKNLKCIIIDEAHNFASGDRGSHILSLLERLEYPLEKLPQRIAVTATIGNPDDMLLWLAGNKRKPGKRIHVTSKKQKEKDYKVYFFDEMNDVNDDEFETLAINRLHDTLYKMLPNKKSLVFINSRSGSEGLASKINEMNLSIGSRNPVKIRTHHSSVSKFYREYAELQIQIKNESGLNAIINTSTLELGIDIGELDQVIQFRTLTHSSVFLQRVGRTGRRENKPQVFRGLDTNRDDLLIMCAVINLGLKGICEKIEFPKKSFHILAHQLICLTLQMNGIDPDLAWSVLSNAHCFSEITKAEFIFLIDFMVKEKYLRCVDDELIIGEVGEKSLLGANWRRLFAVFDDAPLYDVTDGKTHVGTLDSSFVESQSTPFIFVLGGIEWNAKEIKFKNRQVLAEKTHTGKAPLWRTQRGLEVPFETAQEAARILFSSEMPEYLDKEGKEAIMVLKNKYSNIKCSDNNWFVDNEIAGICNIWTFAGDKLNRTLCEILKFYKLGMIESNYIKVEIKRKENIENLKKDILEILNNLKTINNKNLNKIKSDIINTLLPIPFSKYSKCLSNNLTKEVLGEKAFELNNLLKLINNINF